jgi:hypothetical protein
MARQFERTDETIKVINGHAQAVAEEYGCIDKYIYNICSGNETDPFAKFEWLFSAAVRAGCDVSPWIQRLKAIAARYESKSLSLETEACRFVKEAADVSVAVINHKPLPEQLAEACEAERQAARLKRAILDRIADEKGQTNGNRFARAK